MKRLSVIQKIIEYDIVAVVMAESKEQGIKNSGGIKAFEINMKNERSLNFW